MPVITIETDEETKEKLEEFKEEWGLSWEGVAKMMAAVCDDIEVSLN